MDLEIPTSLDEITCQLSQAAFCALRAAKYLSKYLAGSLKPIGHPSIWDMLILLKVCIAVLSFFLASNNVETNLQMH